MGKPRSGPASAPSKKQRTVLHKNLLLVRGTAAQLDGLLSRASLRRALVYRIGPGEVLLRRDALAELFKEDNKDAVVFVEFGT